MNKQYLQSNINLVLTLLKNKHYFSDATFEREIINGVSDKEILHLDCTKVNKIVVDILQELNDYLKD